jgi:hypothetical protein
MKALLFLLSFFMLGCSTTSDKESDVENNAGQKPVYERAR